MFLKLLICSFECIISFQHLKLSRYSGKLVLEMLHQCPTAYVGNKTCRNTKALL